MYNTGKLKIRIGTTKEDVEYTRVLSVEAHNEGRFRDYKFSHEKRDAFLMNSVNYPNLWRLIIAEIENEPVGFLFCTANDYMVGVDGKLTAVYAYYVRKQFRENMIGGKAAILLMRSCINWSKKMGSREVMVHATSGINPKRTDSFLKRTGFSTIGGNYSLALSRLENK